MDQAKEYLRLAIKYRFWIIVGVSALLPIIGYAVVAGDIESRTATLTSTIKGADSGVKPFQNGVPAVPRWTELAKGKTEVVTDDVNKSWRKLYERQAPLLDWPKEVEDNFKKWGDGWPKDVDPNKIGLTIDDYVHVYPKYVDKVYKSFTPWDPEEGTGIVVSPGSEVLLRPAHFTEHNPPTLGKVHVAQKRLWIQRTLLDIVHNVNEQAKAKDWDGAWIKQITGLEVASAVAQDQKSAAEGKALVTPDEPVNPNAPAAPPVAAPEMGSQGGSSRGGPGMGAGSMGGIGGGGAGASTDPEINQFIDAGASKDKYDIVPVALSFYVEQSRIPDVLIAFENSPMAIQVVDVDWNRPEARVRKPVKGEITGLFDNYGDLGGRGNSLIGGRRGSAMMSAAGGMGGMLGRSQLDMDRIRQGSAGGGMAGMMENFNPGGAEKTVRKGTDRREAAKKAAKEKAEKEKEKEKGKGDKEPAKKAESRADTIADPYYNIVEVHIYGQARFYKRPPTEAQPAASPGSAPAAEAAKDQPAAAPDAKKDEPKDEANKDASKNDEPKTETKKDDAKGDEPKAEPKADLSKEAAKSDDPKKDESKKGEPAKADAAKDEPKSKDETPKR